MLWFGWRARIRNFDLLIQVCDAFDGLSGDASASSPPDDVAGDGESDGAIRGGQTSPKSGYGGQASPDGNPSGQPSI
jgi:hypothetical protein